MSASWVARSIVTPTSRMRAGNGPARRLTMAKMRGQPALAQQLPEAQDRRVVALDVADLDRHAGRAARGNDRQRLGVRRGKRLLDEDRHATRDRRLGERAVEGRRRGDDHAVELGLGDHRHRVREARGTGLGGGGRDGVGVRVRDGGQARLRVTRRRRARGCGPSNPGR